VATATTVAHFVAQGVAFKINNDECVGIYGLLLILIKNVSMMKNMQ
jgi:hypothetical protein